MPQPWAKLDRDPDGTIRAALPLADHSLDVAATFEALLDGGAWERALTETAGRLLTALDRVRLIVLVALHDIGKVNWGFQKRTDPHAPPVGHEGQVAALLNDRVLSASPPGEALLDIVRDWGAFRYFAPLMAHHGRPREEFGPPPRSGGANETWKVHVHVWERSGDYDPLAEAARLIAAVRERYRQAWEPGPKLPDTPRFISLFAGLVTLADWIGSDQRRFPVEGPYGAERETMRGEAARKAVAARGLGPLDMQPTDFATAFALPAPRGVQSEAAADDLGRIALIEAETGSGKTEAALWRWLRLRDAGEVDGLFFALPTRSAAVQLHRRVQDMLARVWGSGAVEAVLAVPGYIRAGDAEGQALPGYAVRWDRDQSGGGADARWAAERSNRFLAARVAVGTIDQVLLGGLRVRHAATRAAALARSLLVVDEVHASDAYMGALLERVLHNHVGAGGHALLLSATLGGEARARLLGRPLPSLAEAAAEPYPALAGTDAPLRTASATGAPAKSVAIEIAPIIDDAGAIADRAIAAARQGASVLVVRNSVGGAIAVAQAVEERAPDLAFQVGDVATLHHGRFAPADRRLLDNAVERAFGKDRDARGRVLIGTQTLEQSLDIDADLLLADLAPMDVLLQRIGRLHRHAGKDRGAFAQARAIVLVPAERDLTRLLGRVRERHGLGPMADGGGVYPDLRQIEATLRLLGANPQVAIPADNRRLVEHALHSEVLDAIAAELGTAWTNHANDREGIGHAERQTAIGQSLDLATPFRDWVFPDAAERIATRLGARDWLIDCEPPFTGPFGKPVTRIAIPHWMATGITPEDEPEWLDADGAGRRFRIGVRTFVYGRWGLAPG